MMSDSRVESSPSPLSNNHEKVVSGWDQESFAKRMTIRFEKVRVLLSGNEETALQYNGKENSRN